MRILLVSPFPPKLGGVSVSSERLYNNLKEEGYDVTKYNIRFNDERYDIPLLLSIRFFLLPFYIIFHPGFDIIHFHIPGVLRKLYVVLFKQLYGSAKVVFTIHGDITPLLSHTIVKWILSKADKIICVQTGDSAKLPSNLRSKSIDNPAFILPTKINLDGLSQNILDFVHRNDSKLIIYYGSVRLGSDFPDLYGIKEMIELFLHLQKEQFPIRMLAFVNYNEDNAKEKAFLNDQLSKISKSNNFLCIINNKCSILGLYQYADIYLRPTKTDGDSLAVREAMTLGCTVVASDKAIRPKGTIVYSDNEDMFLKVRKCIFSKDRKVRNIDNSFYRKIVELYESIS